MKITKRIIEALESRRIRKEAARAHNERLNNNK